MRLASRPTQNLIPDRIYEVQLEPPFFFLQKHVDRNYKSLLILTESPAEGRIRPLWRIRGELAQWLEQRNHNPLVPSSNLGFATNESGAYV